MKYDHYIDCLTANSLETGELKVFYDFDSGTQDNPVGDYVFNLNYPTGDHFILGVENFAGTCSDNQYTTKVQCDAAQETWTYAPVVNSTLLPGFSIGKTDKPVTNYGLFDKDDLVRVGLNIPFSGWTAVMDINPSLCDYRDENMLSRVLFSTMNHYESASGFFVGINQSNRLYIQYNNDSAPVSQTLNREINAHSVVSVLKDSNQISVGFYDMELESSEFASLSSQDILNSDIMYLGNFLEEAEYPEGHAYVGHSKPEQIYYTGYQGYIRNFALYDSAIAGDTVNSQCRCMFANGTNVTTITSEIRIPNVTGFEETAVYTTGITGYEIRNKYVIDSDGTSVLTAFSSGVTGLIEQGTQTTFLTGDITTNSSSQDITGVTYDQEKLGLYNRYFLNFKNGLASGEQLEISVFDDPRTDTQLKLVEDKVSGDTIRLYHYGLFQQSINDATIFTSGLDSTAVIADGKDGGHFYDYEIFGDKSLTGYDIGEHNLTYDIIDNNAICVDFSGSWLEHRVNLGTSLNPNYWPSYPQFVQTGTKNLVKITGVSGQHVHDRHIYYNGQKLIEGLDYSTGFYRTGNSENNANLQEWDLPVDVPCVTIHSGLGGFIPGPSSDIKDVYTPELCFVPMVTGEKPSIIRKTIQNCTVPPFCSDTQYITKATCLEDGTCSDNQYTTEISCLEYDGTCTDISFTNKTDCESAQETWSPTNTWTITNTWTDTYATKTICETAGGTWAPIDGIPDPISGFSEMIWVNGIRQERDTDYRKGRECSSTKSFTFFDETPLNFYNNNEDYVDLG
jgi:hypothetical protein